MIISCFIDQRLRLGPRRHALGQPRLAGGGWLLSWASPLARVLYALLFNPLGMPSFVATLTGLLAILGLQLYVLGAAGSSEKVRHAPSMSRKLSRPVFPNSLMELFCASTHRKALAASRARRSLGRSGEPLTPTRTICWLMVAGAGLLRTPPCRRIGRVVGIGTVSLWSEADGRARETSTSHLLLSAGGSPASSYARYAGTLTRNMPHLENRLLWATRSVYGHVHFDHLYLFHIVRLLCCYSIGLLIVFSVVHPQESRRPSGSATVQ